MSGQTFKELNDQWNYFTKDVMDMPSHFIRLCFMSHMVFYNIKNIISIYKRIVKYDHNKEMK